MELLKIFQGRDKMNWALLVSRTLYYQALAVPCRGEIPRMTYSRSLVLFLMVGWMAVGC